MKTGTRVRFTAQFLRNTGQIAGGEGLSVWEVKDCNCELCKTGRFIAVNQESIFNDGSLRHIMQVNLEKVR